MYRVVCYRIDKYDEEFFIAHCEHCFHLNKYSEDGFNKNMWHAFKNDGEPFIDHYLCEDCVADFYFVLECVDDDVFLCQPCGE